uniref:BM1P2 n=1 Tax=Priestia megaterium TaxID=1404 RepID=Q45309_PRIMG|nr:BM1P2 [Priestia megaterium]
MWKLVVSYLPEGPVFIQAVLVFSSIYYYKLLSGIRKFRGRVMEVKKWKSAVKKIGNHANEKENKQESIHQDSSNHVTDLSKNDFLFSY